MVPPPRGTSSGLVSPDEEQDDVEDMASPRGRCSTELQSAARERERKSADQSGALTWSLGEEQEKKKRETCEHGDVGDVQRFTSNVCVFISNGCNVCKQLHEPVNKSEEIKIESL